NCGDPPEIQNAEKVKNVTSRFRMKCKEGYLREAGTSNLFKCENNTWRNVPTLVCKKLDTATPSVAPSQSSLTQKITGMDEKGQSTTNGMYGVSNCTGKTVFTTTHKATTTSQTSCQTSQRTTTMEETSVTTPISARITASSTTEKEILITMSTSSSLITTGYVGISLGIVLPLILGVAAAVAVLIMCRRSKPCRSGGNPVQMTGLTHGSEQPLMMNVTSSGAPDSVQSSFAPFKDASEAVYANDPLSV
ncbi:interleukin-15 receptor subunit alpha isoform X1, partial [Tachysurus ichikawai]